MANEHVYETVVVLTPELEEAAVEEHIKKLKNQIGDLGGSIESVDLWGRRRLEYEIQRKREGIYYVVLFKVETTKNPIARIERTMRLDEQVLRSLTVRRDDLMKSRAQKMRQKREERKAKREARQAEVAAQRAAEAKAAISESEEQAEEKATAES